MSQRPVTASCAGKVGFLTLAAATSANERNRFKRAVQKSRQAYKCGICGKWHLGQRAGKDVAKTLTAIRRGRLMELRGQDD